MGNIRNTGTMKVCRTRGIVTSMADNTMAGFRLSAQQERVWAQQQDSQRTPLGAQCVVRLDGTVDAALLQESVKKTVQRFEILRTVFHRQPGLKIPVPGYS